MIEQLAESHELGSVHRLRTGQIELLWNGTSVPLRVADLLVLDKALQAQMGDVNRPWATTYALVLKAPVPNECRLFIEHDELYELCAMVHEAAEQIPRRVVRWADLEVTLVPCTGGSFLQAYGFSVN